MWDPIHKSVLSPGHLSHMFLKCHSSQKNVQKQPRQNLLKTDGGCAAEGDDDKNKRHRNVRAVCQRGTRMLEESQKMMHY